MRNRFQIKVFSRMRPVKKLQKFCLHLVRGQRKKFSWNRNFSSFSLNINGYCWNTFINHMQTRLTQPGKCEQASLAHPVVDLQTIDKKVEIWRRPFCAFGSPPTLCSNSVHFQLCSYKLTAGCDSHLRSSFRRFGCDLWVCFSDNH